MNLYDAHNHLQDERLAPHLPQIISEIEKAGIEKMVVNGSCEEDWPQVLELARRHPFVIPSFGYHPWYVKERTGDWQKNLLHHLEAVPSAIGEIGLDRWIENFDLPAQEEVFVFQLRLAVEKNLPVSIHCLQAWGRLLELLQSNPLPHCGFLLHSYGGPKEMIEPLAKLGAYFSLPGYFAHERKVKQRETFKHVPRNRLLIETDAPDQLLPDEKNLFPLNDQRTGKPLNHPANVKAVYVFAAEFLNESLETLTGRVEENFKRLFEPVFCRSNAARTE
ncbi:MAG: TatD family hydrolase [Verrucomicrobia bacterium]|nr:TatD family hydrolase [Verrucomicrobiota bacterium]